MARDSTVISFEEFSNNVEEFFGRVVQRLEEVVIKDEKGKTAVLKPLTRTRRRMQKPRLGAEDRASFLATAGGWRDLVDTEKLKRDIYESRRFSSRPQIKL